MGPQSRILFSVSCLALVRTVYPEDIVGGEFGVSRFQFKASFLQKSKVPNCRIRRVVISGIVIVALGRYHTAGYLDS